MLLQPKRQPPAIQIETLIERSNRTNLFEKNRLISVLKSTPAPSFCRESFAKLLCSFCNGALVSLNAMSIDKNKIKTQDELEEPAPMDRADQRVEAEMKELEKQAKRDVAEGLRNQDEGNE